MKIENFTIENFKGIRKTAVRTGLGPLGSIVTLIGLNESGKTTILEAISNFVTEDEETSSLVGTVQRRQSPDELVPKAVKGMFTGRISVEASILMDDADVDAMRSSLLEHGFRLDTLSHAKRITVERRFSFQDGDLEETRAYWNLKVTGWRGKAKKSRALSSTGDDATAWHAAVGALKERMPKIVYFPTFLFDFPERIYLRDPPDWDESSEQAIINRYYRRVLQNVADSIVSADGQRISIEKQVVQRLEEVKEPSNNPLNFWSYFTTQKEHDKVRSVLNSVADRMGRVVFDAWNTIFSKSTVGSRVQIDFGVDAARGNLPWIEISIFDGKSTYALNERSLGFRWFFSFLLFTQFRKSSSAAVESIFLFDEPAANLHSLAQMRLMETFSLLAASGSTVIYSTHSHYLVNPLWLENAYIVTNTAIDYDADLDVAATPSAVTDIKANAYRNFVNDNPSRVSYYQPALDALQFHLGPMIPRNYAVIVEGKFDFHPLEYFRRKFDSASNLSFFPINGAGDAAALIALFRGWGISYCILLDDDQGGKQAARKYSDLGVPSERLIVLGDLDPKWKGVAFETIYSPEVDTLAKHFAKKGKITKRSYFELFVDRCATANYLESMGATEDAAQLILGGLEDRFAALK